MPLPAAAQIRDTEGMQLQLTKQVQDPTAQTVRFDLAIYPFITSDRVQIRWQVSGPAEIVFPETQTPASARVNLSLQADQPSANYIVIKPRGFGRIDIRATVEAFGSEGARVASATAVIGANTTGVIVPPHPQQGIADLVSALQTLATWTAVGLFLYLAGGEAYKRFRVWLHKGKQDDYL